MSIRTRKALVAVVAIVPGAGALSLFYLAAIAQAPGDRHRLFGYALLCVLVVVICGPMMWIYHLMCVHLDLHDEAADDIADLRCTLRRLEDNLEDLAYAQAGYVPPGALLPPPPRLRVVPTPAAE